MYICYAIIDDVFRQGVKENSPWFWHNHKELQKQHASSVFLCVLWSEFFMKQRYLLCDFLP